MKRVIYDFGANNGDDIPYYLMKADLVVAVEANPALCEQMEKRFRAELAEGSLVIINRVLSVEGSEQTVDFYVHKEESVWSQFPKPSENEKEYFSKVQLESTSPMHLFETYGDPYYVKIDLENYDKVILRYLFEHRIFPKYLSAECHCAEVYSLMVSGGGYDAFKLVEGESVARYYRGRKIEDREGEARFYSFPDHSAGPFGEDVRGDWLSSKAMLRRLGVQGCGWKDLHAKRDAVGIPTVRLMSEVLNFCWMKICRIWK